MHPAVVGILVGIGRLRPFRRARVLRRGAGSGPAADLDLPPITARIAITATTTMTTTSAAPAIHQPTGDFFFCELLIVRVRAAGSGGRRAVAALAVAGLAVAALTVRSAGPPPWPPPP